MLKGCWRSAVSWLALLRKLLLSASLWEILRRGKAWLLIGWYFFPRGKTYQCLGWCVMMCPVKSRVKEIVAFAQAKQSLPSLCGGECVHVYVWALRTQVTEVSKVTKNSKATKAKKQRNVSFVGDIWGSLFGEPIWPICCFLKVCIPTVQGSTLLASCTAVAKSTGDGWCPDLGWEAMAVPHGYLPMARCLALRCFK